MEVAEVQGHGEVAFFAPPSKALAGPTWSEMGRAVSPRDVLAEPHIRRTRLRKATAALFKTIYVATSFHITEYFLI